MNVSQELELLPFNEYFAMLLFLFRAGVKVLNSSMSGKGRVCESRGAIATQVATNNSDLISIDRHYYSYDKFIFFGTSLSKLAKSSACASSEAKIRLRRSLLVGSLLPMLFMISR